MNAGDTVAGIHGAALKAGSPASVPDDLLTAY
jgi:hypothetical protein